MERKLASVREVGGVASIPNADNLEAARVDGWWVVVRKGEVVPGSKVVFFEIDSVLPDDPEEWPQFQFLKNRSNMRVKTAKLRGQVSQGLVFPIEQLFEESVCSRAEVGDDLTKVIGVKKYEPYVSPEMEGEIIGSLPGFIPKTDQERAQNLPDYIATLGGVSFEITEKLDGTSMTVYAKDGHFGVCGRSREFDPSSNNTYWQISRELGLEQRLGSADANVALQGELVGPGIQGNPLKLENRAWYVFDVYDINRSCYFSPEDRYHFLDEIGLLHQHVPIYSENFVMPDKVDLHELLFLASGFSLLNPPKEREGLVFKPHEPHTGESFKVVSNRYLLNQGG